MVYSPVTFVSSFRSTHSDVMSVTNTTIAKGPSSSSVPAGSAVRARLPYKESASFSIFGSGKLGKHATPVERAKEDELRKRKNRELMAERDVFMGKLNAERETRTRVESRGAIYIQKMVRGWLCPRRSKSEYERALKNDRQASRLLQNTRHNLTHDLLEMTEAVGLPPIPGMTLNSRKMMEKQRIEDELRHEEAMEKAAVEIQSIMRQRMDSKIAESRRLVKLEVMKSMSAVVIQCQLRGMWGRMRFNQVLADEQARAITIIQARIRSKRDRFDTDQKKRAFALERRRKNAAILMQSIWRGKVSRRTISAKSYAKVYRRKQQSMYEKMDRKGLTGIELQEARSTNVSPVLGGRGAPTYSPPLTKIASSATLEVVNLEIGPYSQKINK
jgi:hypothetical protein